MRRLRAAVLSIPSWQLTFAIALLVLGFLIAAQLRSEGPRVRYASSERPPLVETANGLQQQQDGLKSRLVQLRQQVQSLETSDQGSAAATQDLDARVRSARVAAGLTALQGPGVVLQLRDSSRPVPPGGNPTDLLVSASDIRTMVDELWLAGAEAIAINGERVAASTAVLDIGGTVLVNAAYLAPPYQIAAIGPSDLFDQVSSSASFRAFVAARVDAFGIEVGYDELPNVNIPAYAGTLTMRYARSTAGGPGASVAP